MNNFLLMFLQHFVLVSICVLAWTSIIRDLAQIRAAQKIEIETIARLAKLLNVEMEDEI